mgnify:CR=1 FL=1
MKVILTQDVRGQGKRGQMIEVSDGYARNFLLPRKLAQEAGLLRFQCLRGLPLKQLLVHRCSHPSGKEF